MYITSAHAGATNDKLVMDGDFFHRHTLETSLYKDYTFEQCTSHSETQSWSNRSLARKGRTITSFRTATLGRNQLLKSSATFRATETSCWCATVPRRRPRSASLLSAPLSTAIKKFNKSHMRVFSICIIL